MGTCLSACVMYHMSLSVCVIYYVSLSECLCNTSYEYL